MAIVLDSTLVGTGGVNGANSNPLSNFSTGGTNRVVLVESDESQDASTVASVTATGLTFTKLGSVNKGASQGNVEIWGAWAAAQQTNVAITINYTGSNFPQGAGRTECWSGTADGSVLIANVVNSVAATGAFGIGANPTVNITTTKANSQVVAAVGVDGSGGITAGSNQTLEGSNASLGGVSEVGALYQNANTAASGTVVTMNATLAVGASSGIVALEIFAPSVSAPQISRVNNVRYLGLRRTIVKPIPSPRYRYSITTTGSPAGPFGAAYFGQPYFGDSDNKPSTVTQLGELALLGVG